MMTSTSPSAIESPLQETPKDTGSNEASVVDTGVADVNPTEQEQEESNQKDSDDFTKYLEADDESPAEDAMAEKPTAENEVKGDGYTDAPEALSTYPEASTNDLKEEDAPMGSLITNTENNELEDLLEDEISIDENKVKNEELSNTEVVSEPQGSSEPKDDVQMEDIEPNDPDLAASQNQDSTGANANASTTEGEGNLQPQGEIPVKHEADELSLQPQERQIESEPEPTLPPADAVKQTHVIIVPSYASWFNMKKIHKIEKESLPEFFETNHPSKSAKIYLNYRNFMINSYRLNPNEYLTLTSCRRNLVGDVGTLMRVHRFLNLWGLINYQVRPQFKPGYALDRLPNGNLVGLPYTGDFQVRYDTPRGLFPFETFKISPERVDIPKLKKLLNIEKSDSNGKGANGTPKGASTNLKTASVESEHEGVQPKKQKTDNWTTEERAKLLLAVKQHRDDWYKVAEFVGNNKTPQECILTYLRIPIEDKFNPVGNSDLSDTALKLLKYAPNFPVSSIDNPVLSNLTFMTQLVEPDVAKAASVRASKVMDEKVMDKIREVYDKKEEETKKKEEDKADDEKKEANGSILDKSVSPEKEEVSTDPEVIQKKKEIAEILEKERVEEEEERKKEGSSDVLKDAITNTFGVVGARSHLLATCEERELHRMSANIVNSQLSKIDVKLSKIEELERIYERERKLLAKQQEEVFLDRLALARSTISITKKLDEAVNVLKKSGGDSPDITSLLTEAKSLLYKPTRQTLKEETAKEVYDEKSGDAEVPSEEEMKPLSKEAPQTFKVWAP